MYQRYNNLNLKVSQPIRHRTFSLYNYYITQGRVPSNADMLNSTTRSDGSLTQNKNNQTDKNKLNKIKYASFKYNIPGTTLTVDKQIEIFEDLKTQNIIIWLQEFKNVKELCQLTDHNALLALQALLSPEFYIYIKGTSDLEQAVQKILLKCYPVSNGINYYRELSKIRQDNYLKIS